MALGNLTQLVKVTFVTPVTVAMGVPVPLEDQEIGLKKPPLAQLPLPDPRKLVLLNPQDQQKGRIQGTKQGPLQEQPVTDGTKAKKERTKAPGGETKAITEIKAIGNVLPHKLVVLKGLHKGPSPRLAKPQDNRPVL